MELYRRKVQYYETDRMGITHHSNYIRWMEEARVNYLEKIGCGYDAMELAGISSPVLSVQCKYIKTTTFADEVLIKAAIKEFKGVKMIIEYEMYLAEDKSLVFSGESQHCFLNGDFKPINLKKVMPEYYQILSDEIIGESAH